MFRSAHGACMRCTDLHDYISRVVTVTQLLGHVRGGTYLAGFSYVWNGRSRNFVDREEGRLLGSTRDKEFAKSLICFPGQRETEREFLWDPYFVYKLATLRFRMEDDGQTFE